MKAAKSVARKSAVFGMVLMIGACVPYKGTDEDPSGFPPEPRPFPPNSGSGVAGRGGSGPPSSALAGMPVSAEVPPPPLSGGTLLVLADGRTAFASDPDRDQLHVADLHLERLVGSVSLEPRDEPGQSIEGSDGHVLVLLRGAGAIVKLDVRVPAILQRLSVCPAPRGLARAGDEVFVACAGGEVMALAGDTLIERRRFFVERDLRDVVAIDNRLFISRFRSAELLVVSATDGQILERRRAPGSVDANRPANVQTNEPTVLRAADPSVAWRMRPNAAGGVTILHQEASNGELGVTPGGYGANGMCGGVIGAAMTEFPASGGARTSGHLMGTTLPLDFAFSPNGRRMAMVAAGNSRANPNSRFGSQQPVFFMNVGAEAGGGCRPPNPTPPSPDPGEEPIEFRQPVGEPIAVALDGRGRVVVQTREPARLEILSHRGGAILLSTVSRVDTGHTIFHLGTASGLACASCHPEGRDDARSWRFTKLGMRRTQNLLGGVLSTAPFHWGGDMRDMNHLMTEVFSGRMAGPQLDHRQTEVLGQWVDRLPALPSLSPRDTQAVERGQALFNDPAVGCVTCHSGSKLTNNQTVSVGTGEPMQVPSLKGLGWRAPYMHDGCANNLLDRFDRKCGGDRHGNTAHLQPAALTDLAAYLETL